MRAYYISTCLPGGPHELRDCVSIPHLAIPAVWVVIRLLPAEHQRYRNLKIIASQLEQDRIAGALAFLYKSRKSILINSNHKEVHMDHIKLMIYGFIGIGVVVSVIALIVKMLGLARYG